MVRLLLVNWFRRDGRSFYWRENRDPYVVLIAEVLLKKTTAPVVNRFLPKFLKRFPDPARLSRARCSTLAKILQPLGLSDQRARQLHALARAITGRAEPYVPSSRKELLALPGVGDYTANSVLCVSFNQPLPVVDTNVARIVMRVFGVGHSRFEARRSPEIWELASGITGQDPARAVEVNWALLDLGATICKPKQPHCRSCPLKSSCCSSNAGPT
ncbi:MAG: hypothetical protein HS123_07670 [Solibacteraceae bacterium]|nr:hypothetical protein [Solibacteraceae bacterium]